VPGMTDWTAAYGSAKHAGRPAAKARPPGLDDTTVQTLGKLSEAFEVVENARGHLYEFHRMSGMADLTLQDAIRGFRSAGHFGLAADLDEVLVGRDVLPACGRFRSWRATTSCTSRRSGPRQFNVDRVHALRPHDAYRPSFSSPGTTTAFGSV